MVEASLLAKSEILNQEQNREQVRLGFAPKMLCKSRQAHCVTSGESYATVFFMRYFRENTQSTTVIIRPCSAYLGPESPSVQ